MHNQEIIATNPEGRSTRQIITQQEDPIYYAPCTNCWDDSYDVENANILYYLVFSKIPKRIMLISDPKIRSQIRRKIISECRTYFKVRKCNLKNYHLYFTSRSGSLRIPMLKQTLVLLHRFHHGESFDQLVHNDEEEMQRLIGKSTYSSHFLSRFVYKFLTRCEVCRRDKVLKIPSEEDYFQDIYIHIQHMAQNRLLMQPEASEETIDLNRVVFNSEICFYNCRRDHYDEHWDSVLRFVAHNMLPQFAYRASYEEKSQITRNLQAKKKKMIVRKCSRGSDHLWKITNRSQRSMQLRIPMEQQTAYLLKILHGRQHRNMNQMLELLKTKTYYSHSDVKKMIMKKLDFCLKCEDISRLPRSNDSYNYSISGPPDMNRSNPFSQRRGRRGRRPKYSYDRPISTFDHTENEKIRNETFKMIHEIIDPKQRQRMNVFEELRQCSMASRGDDEDQDSIEDKIEDDNMNESKFEGNESQEKQKQEHSNQDNREGPILELITDEEIREKLQQCIQRCLPNQSLKSQTSFNQNTFISLTTLFSEHSSQKLVIKPIQQKDEHHNQNEKIYSGFVIISPEMAQMYLQFGQCLNISEAIEVWRDNSKWFIIKIMVENNHAVSRTIGGICLLEIKEQILKRSFKTYFTSLVQLCISMNINQKQMANNLHPYSITLPYNCNILSPLNQSFECINFSQTHIFYTKKSLLSSMNDKIQQEKQKELIIKTINHLAEDEWMSCQEIDKQLAFLSSICRNKQISNFYSNEKSHFFKQFAQRTCFFASRMINSLAQKTVNGMEEERDPLAAEVLQTLHPLQQNFKISRSQLESLPTSVSSLYGKISDQIFARVLESFLLSQKIILPDSLPDFFSEILVYDSLNNQQYHLEYTVKYQHWSCNCLYIYSSGLPCPHQIATILKFQGELSYYINSRWIIQA